MEEESFDRARITTAPWTDGQIQNLDKRQEADWLHPYTCPRCCESLTPYQDGWHCDYCHQYKQDWAYKDDVEGKFPDHPFKQVPG